MTDKDIQRLIKEKIPKDYMFEFLNNVINEDSIDVYSSLLNLTIIEDKYTFDLIMAILYKESATIETILAIISAYTSTYTDIFEKMVILEYELYEIPGGLSGTPTLAAIKYVRDYIPKLYHGDSSRLSYKDEVNVKTELDKIYLETVTADRTIMEALDASFDAYSMAKINNEISYIETEIAHYSFLINYDVTNKYFIRKENALQTGVYRKLVNGVESQKDLSILTSTTGLYYKYYLSVNQNTDFANAHDFILDFYDKIIKGTIN